MRRAAGIVLVLLGLMTEASAQDATFDQAIVAVQGGDPAAYRRFIGTFQAAVRRHDAQAVAAMVDYPLGATIDGRERTIANADAFVAAYDRIVTLPIAAAVQDEAIEAMMVNDQGVMLGQGEVWISGVCRDDACARSDIRVIAIQPRSDLSPPLDPAQQALAIPVQPSKAFKDWFAGCDNTRSCVAIGTGADGGGNAYVRVARGADAADAATAVVTLLPQSDPVPASATVSLSVDGRPLAQAVPLAVAGDARTATLTGADAERLIAAMLRGHALQVALEDGDASVQAESVSLAGSAAALLYLDDRQGRVGTAAALAKRGPAPASGVPDPAPVYPALAMKALPPPLPALPEGLERPSRDETGCPDDTDLAIALPDGRTLWGLCASSGAYNMFYRFWITGGGPPEPVRFVLPGRTDPDDDVLVNPGLSDDGMTLSAVYKGRGLGDCGTSSEWVWTGEAFKPVRYAEMEDCRMVDPADWPVLYRAERR
ncbi:DUF1176 domain-containing protein [Marinivivus vitaminiproducens]|uniref:DUF1176 domain-containing protein n=1 Tax=Marinivivus vitaminiproducens TaxID=3035935 RepID=UPI0027A0A1C3|nr:DUF1176 domain-containing protein [Geminicoccaceae bacterium SCSIO 64248]